MDDDVRGIIAVEPHHATLRERRAHGFASDLHVDRRRSEGSRCGEHEEQETRDGNERENFRREPRPDLSPQPHGMGIEPGYLTTRATSIDASHFLRDRGERPYASTSSILPKRSLRIAAIQRRDAAPEATGRRHSDRPGSGRGPRDSAAAR